MRGPAFRFRTTWSDNEQALTERRLAAVTHWPAWTAVTYHLTTDPGAHDNETLHAR